MQNSKYVNSISAFFVQNFTPSNLKVSLLVLKQNVFPLICQTMLSFDRLPERINYIFFKKIDCVKRNKNCFEVLKTSRTCSLHIELDLTYFMENFFFWGLKNFFKSLSTSIAKIKSLTFILEKFSHVTPNQGNQKVCCFQVIAGFYCQCFEHQKNSSLSCGHECSSSKLIQISQDSEKWTLKRRTLKFWRL